MGGGASVTALSAADLGAEVGKLGKAYEALEQDIVNNGLTGEFLFSTVCDDEAQFKSLLADNFGYTTQLQQSILFHNYIKAIENTANNVNTVSYPLRILKGECVMTLAEHSKPVVCLLQLADERLCSGRSGILAPGSAI